MAEESRQRLGRGLAALLGDSAPDPEVKAAAVPTRQVSIELLRPNAHNPRKVFDEAALEELSSSIQKRGIIQPIVVRKSANPSETSNVYEIIAGERRWRAAQRAGLHEVPVHVIDADDRMVRELAIIENVQRADLNPIEEAAGYEQLMQDYSYTQQDVGQIIGKSRSHIANTLRLLNLPELTKKLVSHGHLSAGHARALLSLPDPDAVAQRAVAQGLSVRDLEKMVQEQSAPKATAAGPRKAKAEKDADTRQIERELSEATGVKVTIEANNPDNGQVVLRYTSFDQLDAIIERLRQGLQLSQRSN
ncbi:MULTISPECIES: ParB/RepB/Spo0J family partition protein [unclassified Beijerinckia]|uniref:ParB/RepB/Spo0J family partition protein n=1 Tax=unclassified Beijerinckia TaxID=2638183 RepID=UPI00089A509C|nr:MULTISPECIES: ParB/RepB/Spo0J family partition protein [unclassified Beijerinckia]MDH7798005.1 ParB family chromosome partitioning protein [Beijerinckia sp. GAS462]SED05697.1 chromosome segregation DNA-binding protein [Beijerinckia sp. 28-YEA-48]